MSDSKNHQELIQLAHQLFLLISTRPAFIPRLNEQQSSAITWVVKNFDQPNTITHTAPNSSLPSIETQSSKIVVPLSWLNSYDRALKAADRVLSGLPSLQALVNSEISQPPKSIEVGKPMPEINPLLESSQRVDGVGTMTAEQINQLVISIIQNVNQGKNQNQNQIRAQEIGYFEPDVNAIEPVETVNGSTVYHNVFSFTARIRAKVSRSENSPWSSTNLAQKLDQCLKGKAELWYTNEISDTTRAGLQAGHELWCSELEARFRMPAGEALRELHALKYGIEDVRARKDPETFVQKVVLYGMASGTATTVYSQLLFAHQLLDGRLRLNVNPPSESTTLTAFIQSLTAIKATWFDIWLPQRAVVKAQKSINTPFCANHLRSFANESKFLNPYPNTTFEPNKVGKNVEFKSEQLERSKPLLGDRYNKKRAEYRQQYFKRDYVNRGRQKSTKPSNQNSANAYAAEADTLGSDEEATGESSVEEHDPYDDAYFEGIKEDVTEHAQESKPVNYYSAVRNFSVNTINSNDALQSQNMIKRRSCKNAITSETITSKIAHVYCKRTPNSSLL
ncbi:hypothetical protein HI914_06500 [Erysiphe necator]|nr:hypothetical protein HI914_06500 [Erysiphe necator]